MTYSSLTLYDSKYYKIGKKKTRTDNLEQWIQTLHDCSENWMQIGDFSYWDICNVSPVPKPPSNKAIVCNASCWNKHALANQLVRPLQYESYSYLMMMILFIGDWNAHRYNWQWRSDLTKLWLDMCAYLVSYYCYCVSYNLKIITLQSSLQTYIKTNPSTNIDN